MHWDYALILVFLGAVVPLVGRWRVARILRGPETRRAERLRLYASTIAFQWLLTAAIVWRAGRHGTSNHTLGLAADRVIFTAVISAGLVALVLTNQLVSLRLIGKRPEELHSKLAQVALRIFPQHNLERLVFIGVVATVAVCEEFIYRGFVQGLFTNIFRSALAGVLISAGMFSLAHLYQGKRGLIATCVVGLVFGGTRALTGSLVPGIIAHFVVDFVAAFLFPPRLRAALAAEGSETSSR
ncbi:MAG TPA: CPBP family intramembrane glutamic endopeptidase [Candidatus Acidoferrales bacterium]|nr:CPBP family intramembrane glutamic endopeptidase [Candidatus Acidoferrales bacterium]